MSLWDALTWGTVIVLGPGAVLLAVLLARDLWRLLGPGAGDDRA